MQRVAIGGSFEDVGDAKYGAARARVKRVEWRRGRVVAACQHDPLMAILVLPTSRVRRAAARGAARARARRDDLHRSRRRAGRRDRGTARVQARAGHRVAASRICASSPAPAPAPTSCSPTPDLPRTVPDRARRRPAAGQRMAQYVALMALRFHRDLPRSRRSTRRTLAAPGPDAGGANRGRRDGLRLASARRWSTCSRGSAFRSSCGRGRRARSTTSSRFAGADGLRAVPRADPRARLRAAADAGDARRPRRARVRGAAARRVRRSTCRAAPCCARTISSPRVDAGHLAGAALDVFETEPLPATSPLWRHPKILCTPHIAAVPRADVAAAQFLDNLRRARVRRGRSSTSSIARAGTDAGRRRADRRVLARYSTASCLRRADSR